jgi:hypothetical protein
MVCIPSGYGGLSCELIYLQQSFVHFLVRIMPSSLLQDAGPGDSAKAVWGRVWYRHMDNAALACQIAGRLKNRGFPD